MPVVFNGTTRQVEITDPLIFELEAGKELYSAWKRWQQLDPANAGYAPAFRTFGGDPTATGQTAPKYFFLINLWTILINNGNIVTVALNLYSDDFVTPYVVLAGSGVSDRNSDAVNVNEEDIKSQSFIDAEITLDIGDGTPGIIYPIGTPPRPSDNLPDALTIMHNQNLHKIKLTGFITATGTEILDQIKVTGGSGSSNVVILAGTTTAESEFQHLIVTGAFDGLPRVTDCILGTTGLGGVTGVEGRIKDSIINHVDGIIQKVGGAGTLLDNCSFVTPNDQQVTFNANGEGFGFRNVTGNVIITNMTKVEALQVHISGAIVELAPSCTAGTLTFTGSGTLIDNSSGTTVVDELNVGGVGGAADWTTGEKEQMRSALGVDGTKTTATGGQLQVIKDQSEISALNAVDELDE